MSVDVVKEMYDAMTEGDMPKFFSFIAKDCQWDHRGPPGPPINRVFTGPEGVEEFFRLYDETQEMTEFTVEEYLGAGDRVVALGVAHHRVRATGKEHGGEFALTHTVRDGKVVHWKPIFDMAAEADAHMP